MVLWEVFLSFAIVGLLGFGGGMAAMPLIQSQVVGLHGWMSLEELAGVIAISELTPGPFAINSATFVGTHVGGFWGALLATTGFLLPSMVISSALALVYKKLQHSTLFQGVLKGLNFAVAGLVSFSACTFIYLAIFSDVSLKSATFEIIPFAIFAAGFFLMKKFKVNSILIILGSGILGGALYNFI